MAAKRKLRGSFESLSDTLAFRSDPSFPEEVSGRWLGVMAHAAAIARRHAAWSALPDESDAFDPVIAALNDAADALAVAGDTGSRFQALDRADQSLDELGSLLDATGEP